MTRVRNNDVPGDPPVAQTLGTEWQALYTRDAFVSSNEDNPLLHKIAASLRPWQEKTSCVDELHAGPPYIDGGNFLLQRMQYWKPWLTEPNSVRATYINGIYRREYYRTTRYYCQFSPVSGYSLPLYNEDKSCVGYSAQAWRMLKPVKPSAGLGVFLGELRDMPRMLKTTHEGLLAVMRAGSNPSLLNPKNWGKINPKKFGKKVGAQWLNANFGWLPFLSDLRRFYQTYANLRAMLDRIERNAGKWVETRCTIDESNDSELIRDSVGVNCMSPLCKYGNLWLKATVPDSPYYRTVVRSTTSKKVWAVAKFRYYLPDMPTYWWEKKAIAYLFGVWPNPSVLYDLTPYTWLIDWFTNLGDIVESLDNELVEDLAMRDGYLMGRESKNYEITGTHYYADGPYSATFKLCNEFKERKESKSNFSFSLDEDNLTPRQWSILAALGLTRL